MNEKKKLLSQLKIDRDEDIKQGLSVGVVLFLLLVVLLIGLGIGKFIFPSNNMSQLSQNGKVRSGDLSSDKISSGKIEKKETLQKTVKTLSPLSDSIKKRQGEQAILDASGYITARRMATVSSEITGRITNVLVEEGMSVKAGQVLATLDDAISKVDLNLAKARMKSAEARVESAHAAYNEAKRVLARVSKLKSSNFSSEATLTNSILTSETTKAGLARAKAELEVARLEVARQQERLDDHTVRAPFSGVVTIKNAQEGEIVSPVSAGGGFTRTGICTIVDMASLEIEADVNEAFIGRISQGQKVKAKLDAYPDWSIPASVIAIIPTANRNKATVRVRIKIESNDPRILPDMGVKISFYK